MSGKQSNASEASRLHLRGREGAQVKMYFGLGGVLVLFLTLTPRLCIAETAIGDLVIVAGVDTVLVGSDICSYDAVSGILSLTAEGSDRWSKWGRSQMVGKKEIPKLSRLTGRPFRVEVSGQLVAEGHFTSMASSQLYAGLVAYDSLILPGDNHLRLVTGGAPGSSDSMDFSKAEALVEYFRVRGISIEGERER